MADIFISYASEDRACVKPLADALGQQGWSVWWDRTSIRTGKTFDEAIEEALTEARCVVVVWTSKSVNSHWVRDEATVGRDRGILAPVSMDGVKPPLGFRQFQTAHLIEWDGQESSPDFHKLITDLTAILGSAESPDEKVGSPPTVVEPAELVSPTETKPQPVTEGDDARRRADKHEKASMTSIPPWVRSWQFAAAAIVVLLIGGYFGFRPESMLASEALAETASVEVNHLDGLEYVRIPAGVFQMGCVPSDTCDDDEKPRHDVGINKDFWIGRTEVTVGAYQKFATATSREMPPAPDFNQNWQFKEHPVNRVTWDEADAYCGWADGRLPTEAEWEYAARGGEEGRKYPWGNEISHDQANYGADECCSGLAEGKDAWEFASPVGSFSGNGFGLHDMVGNVWEWVADWYDGDYYSTLRSDKPAVGPKGPEEPTVRRVLRGGSWFDNPVYLRSSGRVWLEPQYRRGNIGFRCAQEVSFP